MAGLQRSQVSFRRQGSSGLIWDDKLLSGELGKTQNQETEHHQDEEQSKKLQDQKKMDGGDFIKPINTLERSRSAGGGRGYRTGKVSPAIEPPSPRLSVCGFCSSFGKQGKVVPKVKNRRGRTGKPRSR